MQFLNQRIAAEEQYSSKLADISRSKSRADGFGKDESLLGQIFGNAKQVGGKRSDQLKLEAT